MKMGILGAGQIAGVMANTVRLLNENGHPEVELYAVGARDLSRAQAFAKAYGVHKAFGNYEEMLSDPDLDLVYIATPHSHHYRHIKLCADHGKHILCEKSFTVSARQAEDAIRYARSKGVLVTEAIWTRYQPMRRLIRETLDAGLIGEPRLLTANLGYFITGNHRIVVPELAGGALLDVGVYTLNFAEMVFGRPDAIHGLCTKNENGVDLTDSITMTWQDGRVANLTAAANAVSDRYGVIYGTKGYMMVETELEHTDSDFDREKLQERLAKLSGGVAVIKVGAATETELKEIKHRVEDALQATRAAVEEGIVAGGGVAFMDAIPALDGIAYDDPEEKIGIEIVKKALTAPVATIAKNAGFEGAVVVDKVATLPAGEGLNSANGEWGDMIKMGVLDPVKVTRTTLQNAASVASLILITEATVTDVPKNTALEDAIAAATANAQGGGMY